MEWKFKVGDIVRHVASDFLASSGEERSEKVTLRWRGSTCVRYIILELIWQQCHGGIQTWYRCRLVNSNGAVPYQHPFYVDLAEFELEKFQPIREEKVDG